jgi:hypothetical protein
LHFPVSSAMLKLKKKKNGVAEIVTNLNISYLQIDTS